MNVLDLYKLTDKTALVTGGAKGLGMEINKGLLEAGIQTLIFCGRGRHGSLEDEKIRLKTDFPKANITDFQCDISDEKQVVSMVRALKNNMNIENIDILVNNAGVTWAAPTIEQTLSNWNRVIDTNLTGTFIITREIAREFMLPNSRGSIINISSLLAFLGTDVLGQIGYSASKSAILGLTKQLAIEWAPVIRVNAIVPSFFDGNDSMARNIVNSPARDTILDMIPLRRFAHASDLKAAVCFLASEASSFITGQTLILDGGQSIK
jgi:NAD(P)-dependent dehydrogenase (short-subunit alcohol dehydrogenase family)